MIRELIIDGNTVDNNPANTHRGLGVVTGNNSSRLLIDYKAMAPASYWEIMDLLFKPEYGAGLTHIKIELGADINSSSGTEPCVKRTADEKVNITRGAGFVFAADAKKINPEITIDFLRWGEPQWVTKEFSKSKNDGFAARYKWFKETIDAAFEMYNLKFDYISADANETGEADEEWIIYLSEHLKSEASQRYDYSQIKIVASDEVGSRTIAEKMVRNERLRKAVDVIGLHYTTYGDENTALLNEKYGKEIWYSEGIAPCNVSRYSVNADNSGISGINSVIDVTNRIINSYCHGSMIMYEYQPAVAAYYTGSNYAPKQLITAEQPWNGYYETDSGLWGAAHITHFIKKGWKYIKSACFGDGKENHYITETTENHMALMSDDGDYTLILTNDSDKVRQYNVCIKNIEKSDSYVYCVETCGPENQLNYNSNWFKVTDKIIPLKKNDRYFYRIDVKPYSIMTCTTLSVENVNGINSIKSLDNKPSCMPLPYTDSFNYSNNFMKTRGNAPLYTTDQGGAFEVELFENQNVLTQQITREIIPTNWRFRGTPLPATNLGDDRWTNYRAEVEVLFASDDKENYAGIGVRYNSAVTCDETAEGGYQLRIFPDNKWQLKYFDTILANGKDNGIDASGWNLLSISANHQTIKCSINKNLICEYKISAPMVVAGRISFYSSLYKNKFRNLSIVPFDNIPYSSKREDCLSGNIHYFGGWTRNAMDSFKFYNRTSVTNNEKDSFIEYTFNGKMIAFVGEAEDLHLKIEIDDKIISAGYNIDKCGSKQAFLYLDNLTDCEHRIKLTVLSGKISLDCVITEEKCDTLKKNMSAVKENENTKRMKKVKLSTLLVGASLATASVASFFIGRKIRKTKKKK